MRLIEIYHMRGCKPIVRFRGLLARQRGLRFETGICVPASCNASEVRRYANTWMGQADLILTGNPFCQVKNQISLSVLDYFVM